MSSLDQDEIDEQGDEDNRDLESPPSGLRAWTTRASNFVVSKMVLLEQLSEGVGGYLLQPPVPPERTEFSLDPNDEEGTTSGGTSGDDIWGTPTSGGPDDESFTASPVGYRYPLIIFLIFIHSKLKCFEGTCAYDLNDASRKFPCLKKQKFRFTVKFIR